MSNPSATSNVARIEYRPDMSEGELKALRTQLLLEIDQLPQRFHINDLDARVWVDSVLGREPDRAWWHIDRLMGIGGSEIGVLLGAQEGLFHPFTTARKITESKLLRFPLEATNGDMERGTAMEPLAQDKYRKMVISRGGRSRDDLLAKMKGYHDPEHPWLVGNPDDIVEENGKIYIVDYKVPNPDQLAHYDHTGVPFYYAAQVHHYRLIAQKCGIQIDGLRLCSLNTKQWAIDERPVAYSQQLTDDIIAYGDKYWFNHVMAGKPAPTITLKNTRSIHDVDLEVSEVIVPEVDLTDHDDKGRPRYLIDENQEVITTALAAENLKESLVEAAGVFNAWSQLNRESEAMRDMLNGVVATRLPVHAIPVGMDKLEMGAATLRVARAFDPEKLLGAVREQLTRAQMNPEQIEAILDGPNFWTERAFASDKLIDLVQMHLGVDIRKDARFDDAVVAPAQRRQDTLVALAKELDVGCRLDFNAMLDLSRSEVKLEMNREPLSGPFADLKRQTREELRKGAQPTISKVAREYGVARGILQTQREALTAQEAEEKARKAQERKNAAAAKVVATAQKAAEREAIAAQKAAAKEANPAPRRRSSRP